jgi:hypothetical protein
VFIKDRPETVKVTTMKLKSSENTEEVKSRHKSPPQLKTILQQVTFVIPFATPGSGKSFCWEAIRQQIHGQPGWSYRSISSDEVRGELILDIMQQQKCDRDRAFQMTQKSGP